MLLSLYAAHWLVRRLFLFLWSKDLDLSLLSLEVGEETTFSFSAAPGDSALNGERETRHGF